MTESTLVSVVALAEEGSREAETIQESFKRQNWQHRELIFASKLPEGVRRSQGQVCAVWQPGWQYHPDNLRIHARMTSTWKRVELRTSLEEPPSSFSFFRRSLPFLDTPRVKARFVDGAGLALRFAPSEWPDHALGLAMRPYPPAGSMCFVLLGRLGDLINLFPALRALSEAGELPVVIVADEFCDLLTTLPCVKAWSLPIHYGEINRAMLLAHQYFKRVVHAQVWGHNFTCVPQCASFNQEAWRLAGQLNRFHDRALPLVIPKRSPERERALRAKLFKTAAPKIVTNLLAGVSSPFPHGRRILAKFRAAFPNHEVIETGEVTCISPVDLIGLMDSAVMVVAIDTLTLHLALASPTPLVCLVSRGWNGSTPRYNCRGRVYYEVVEENPDVLIKAVKQALTH